MFKGKGFMVVAGAVCALALSAGMVSAQQTESNPLAEKAVQLEAAVQASAPGSPESVDARVQLGATYYALGRYDDAIADCGAIIAANPTADQAGFAAYYKGLSARGKGDIDLTVAAYEAGLRQPAGTYASQMRLRLSEAYSINGDAAKTLAQLDLLESDETASRADRAMALYQKGMYLLASGDQAAGKSALQGVTEKYSDSYLSVRAAQQLTNVK